VITALHARMDIAHCSEEKEETRPFHTTEIAEDFSKYLY